MIKLRFEALDIDAINTITQWIYGKRNATATWMAKRLAQNHAPNEINSVNYAPLNFEEKLAKFDDLWSPKVIAEMNDYQFKLVKVEGDFVWHDHKETDEVFIVLDGQLTIEFRDGAVALSAGEMFVVPKGVEHKPWAAHECHVLLVEPRGVVNTGERSGEKTADNDVWV